MSDTYNPQPWLSPTDQPQRPVSVAVNVTLPGDANQADTGVLMKVAQEIVQGNTTQIDRFIASQRQQQAINPTPYKDVSAKMQGMRARWRMNNGLERLDLEVFPAGGEESGAETSDKNLDGYIAWVHGQPSYPDKLPTGAPQGNGPYYIVLNGYLLETAYSPPMQSTHAGGYLMMFGKTAMLCNSIADDVDKANPNTKNPTLKQPFKVIPPAGGAFTPGASPTGREQRAVQKTFGYWVFDWTSVFNQCNYLSHDTKSLDDPRFDWLNWDGIGQFYAQDGEIGVFMQTPIFDKGIYFPDTGKDGSPLRPLGGNAVGVAPLQTPIISSTTIDVFFAEFYNRGKYRKVQQSWNINSQPHQKIALNDSPMMFGGLNWVTGYQAGQGGVFAFTLDPQATKDDPPPQLTVAPAPGATVQTTNRIGPHDGIYNGMDDTINSFDRAPLNPEQQAVIEAWSKDVASIMKQFIDQQAQDDAAVQAQIDQQIRPKLNDMHNLAFVLRTFAGDARAYSGTGEVGDKSIYREWRNDLRFYEDSNFNLIRPTAGGPAPVYTAKQLELLSGGTITEVRGQAKTYVFTVGGSQTYYLALKKGASLDAFTANSSNGLLLGPPWVEPTFKVTTISDVITGQGTDVTVETFVNQIETVQYDFLKYPDQYIVYGPTSYQGLYAAASGVLSAFAQQWSDLLNQLDAIEARPPPKLPDPPTVGNDLSKFKYSRVTIGEGGSLNYNQNP